MKRTALFSLLFLIWCLKAYGDKPQPVGMVRIPGGDFAMGCERQGESLCTLQGASVTDDALPVHQVHVDAFWMDSTEVTNEQFARFVKATGYKTVAEIPLSAAEFPTLAPAELVAGAGVFTPPAGPVDLRDPLQWWSFVAGADWRHPRGPDSDLRGKEKYPVVQVTYVDAKAYADWAGKRLPSEAEWEFAARGGLHEKFFPWGDTLCPGGKWMANLFQGQFPYQNKESDGFADLAPVAQFPANGYGLYDVAGNVWEWCADWYRPDYYQQSAREGMAVNPRGPSDSYDPDEPDALKRVQRGGSFLCTDQYCSRYMVGTRGKGEVDSSANHVGFRCARSR